MTQSGNIDRILERINSFRVSVEEMKSIVIGGVAGSILKSTVKDTLKEIDI